MSQIFSFMQDALSLAFLLVYTVSVCGSGEFVTEREEGDEEIRWVFDGSQEVREGLELLIGHGHNELS